MPNIPENQPCSLWHWCTICSRSVRPRRSPARGRVSRSASPAIDQTDSTFRISVA
jgi:hypothetical protein